MRVIKPSAHIMFELDQLSVAKRIETCGRLCYKSEARITESSATPFVKNIIQRGHNSVNEMAVLTLKVKLPSGRFNDIICDFLETEPRYVVADYDDNDDTIIVTGSMRAFRDLLISSKDNDIVYAMAAYLSVSQPLFFHDLQVAPEAAHPQISVRKMSLAAVQGLMPSAIMERHRFVAVKFVVNRAVSHELVRHRPCSFLQESQRYCRYDGSSQGAGEIVFIKPLFFDPEGSSYAHWWEAMKDAEYNYLRLLENNSPQAARTVLPNSTKTEVICFANLVQWRHILKLRTSAGCDPSMLEVMVPLANEFKGIFPVNFKQHEVVDAAA